MTTINETQLMAIGQYDARMDTLFRLCAIVWCRAQLPELEFTVEGYPATLRPATTQDIKARPVLYCRVAGAVGSGVTEPRTLRLPDGKRVEFADVFLLPLAPKVVRDAALEVILAWKPFIEAREKLYAEAVQGLLGPA